MNQHTIISLLKETILLFFGITLFGFILELGYDLLKGFSLEQAINEWIAQNSKPRSWIARIIISFGVAYFGILRKEAKVKKQSKSE
jgi:membrane protein DedA with SNARE-associated domain